MINNSFHSILADIALADFLVPVLMGAKRIFRIIEMYCLEPVKTDYLIKFLQNAVKIINYVIAGIINMARVKAIDENDVNEFLKLMEENDFPVILAHAPYTLNLCSAKPETREFARNTFLDD